MGLTKLNIYVLMRTMVEIMCLIIFCLSSTLLIMDTNKPYPTHIQPPSATEAALIHLCVSPYRRISYNITFSFLFTRLFATSNQHIYHLTTQLAVYALNASIHLAFNPQPGCQLIISRDE